MDGGIIAGEGHYCNKLQMQSLARHVIARGESYEAISRSPVSAILIFALSSCFLQFDFSSAAALWQYGDRPAVANRVSGVKEGPEACAGEGGKRLLETSVETAEVAAAFAPVRQSLRNHL